MKALFKLVLHCIKSAPLLARGMVAYKRREFGITRALKARDDERKDRLRNPDKYLGK